MLTVRKADERGVTDIDWLHSRHTFSFGEYHDPGHMGFHTLRVINEDVVDPGAGFGAHPHRDMEIISYVLEGALAHKDSTGGGSVIRPGDVQLMSAGSGVTHSEFNHSKEDPAHFLQIWIVPDKKGLKPAYQQKTFDIKNNPDSWTLLIAPDGKEDVLTIHQDAYVYAASFNPKTTLTYDIKTGRRAWIQVARGMVEVNRQALKAGDGIAAVNESALMICAQQPAELLLFDLG